MPLAKFRRQSDFDMPDGSQPFLTCPACQMAMPLDAHPLICTSCGHAVMRAFDDVYDLRDDPEFDTLLDVETYDGSHNVAVQSHATAKKYEQILRDKGFASFETVLEIGAGSGNLTAGLVASNIFRSVYASELSPSFMRLLQQRLGDQPDEKLRCYLLDANTNPFANDSFGCVLGHSILHHLENFEHTIAECFRVTKPGGVCIFGEPILDIHVYAGLAAGLILDMELARGSDNFKRQRVLRFVAGRSLTKRNNLEGDRSHLREVEDKFVFPIEYMRGLADDVGFRAFDCVSPPNPSDLGQAARGVIARAFSQVEEADAFLDGYAFVFRNLTENLGDPMRLNGMTPFSFLVFQK